MIAEANDKNNLVEAKRGKKLADLDLHVDNTEVIPALIEETVVAAKVFVEDEEIFDEVEEI